MIDRPMMGSKAMPIQEEATLAANTQPLSTFVLLRSVICGLLRSIAK